MTKIGNPLSLVTLLAAMFLLVANDNASAQVDAWSGLTPVGEKRVLQEARYYRVVEERLPDPADGFRAYNVWFETVGDAAQNHVNAFEELNIVGVHQIWDQFRTSIPTPHRGYFEGYNLPGEPLDSHVLWTTGDEFFTSPSEINDGSNPAALSYVELGCLDRGGIYGIGELGITNRDDGPPLAMAIRHGAAQLPFARVVLYDGDATMPAIAWLSGGVGGEGDGLQADGGEVDYFGNVAIGSSQYLVPESAGWVMALALLLVFPAKRGR